MCPNRITVFSNFFWPEGAGADVATRAIMKTLLRERFGIVVVSGTSTPRTDDLQALQYFHWRLLEERVKPLEWVMLFANIGTVKKFIEQSDVVYIPSHSLIPLAIIVRRIKPNARIVIHLHGYQPISYNAVMWSNGRKVNADQVLFELLDHNSLSRALVTGLLIPANYINVLALKQADTILFVSRRQMKIVTARLPWVRSKAVVIPNIPPEIHYAEKNPSSMPTLLYMGGSSILKGFQLVLKAGLTLSKDEPKLKVVITNRISDRANKTIAELNRKCTTFYALGRIDHKDILALLCRAWCLLFPSLWEEPFGYAVMEAMLSGTIPIASRTGGTPELMEGTAAEDYLFEPGNLDQLVERIESVLSFPKEGIVNIGQKIREQTLRKLENEDSEKTLLRVFAS